MMSKEEKVIEAIARALCKADGRDPDSETEWGTDQHPTLIPLWVVYGVKARSFRSAYVAMLEAEIQAA